MVEGNDEASELPLIECYSGGTHATAMHPNTIATLSRAGFKVSLETNSAEYNPVYLVRYSTEHPPERCFSKVYNQPPNPKDHFIAVMTCSEADDACPIVVGASSGMPLPMKILKYPTEHLWNRLPMTNEVNK